MGFRTPSCYLGCGGGGLIWTKLMAQAPSMGAKYGLNSRRKQLDDPHIPNALDIDGISIQISIFRLINRTSHYRRNHVCLH